MNRLCQSLLLVAGAVAIILAGQRFPAARAQTTFPIPAGLPAPIVTGSLIAFAGATAPQGYVLCDGRAVSRTTYSALFRTIGTTYGAGDGSTTFNVPDLRGRAVFGADAMGGTAAGRSIALGSLAATGGTDSQTLSVAQMPAHRHGINDPGHGHPASAHAENVGANFFGGTLGLNWGRGDARGGCCVVVGVGASATGITIAPEGNGQPVSVLNPAIAVNYLIKD
jgi:microcystin-dependent protein